MGIDTLYTALGLLLFVMGFASLALRSSALQRLLAINVIGIGVFMWLIASAFAPGQTDSVPHALVLTGIVVAISATAFALALLVRMHNRKIHAGEAEETS